MIQSQSTVVSKKNSALTQSYSKGCGIQTISFIKLMLKMNQSFTRIFVPWLAMKLLEILVSVFNISVY